MSTNQQSLPSSNAVAEFPEKLAPLFEHPYKVLYGGRDGVKSWSVARALLILGTQKPLRILCARETMDSIRESVHQLLSDQIGNLGLHDFYQVLQSEVRGANGTEFVFAGLRKQTVSSIKSYEAIDICWIEEASVVSRRSLTILLPTIRKPGSEIWFTLNPDLETDAVYQDFVINPPKGAFLCKTSFRDNNWLSPESRDKIDTLRERDFDTYHHVYEGATRSTVEGAIYKQEIQKAENEGRIRSVPYDPMRPVDVFFDLGFADRVAIWAAQRTPFEIRILRYFEDDHQAIDYYLREIQTWGYVLGTCYLPWDGGTKSLGTGKSIEEIMRSKGFKTQVNRQLSVSDGINALRTIFPQFYFDNALCADGLQYLRRYQWGPATQLGVPRSQPLHDDASHPADALRTLAAGIREPERKRPETIEGYVYQGPERMDAVRRKPMAVMLLQVTISGKTQVSATSKKARWVQFANNAAAVMKIGDTNVSSTHGIPLAAAGASGSGFFAPPMGEQAMVHDLSQWFVAGTDAQILDVIYDSVA